MPTRTRTLADHAARIARAMAHPAAQPDRTPSLEELADVAAFTLAVRQAALILPPAEWLTDILLPLQPR